MQTAHMLCISYKSRILNIRYVRLGWGWKCDVYHNGWAHIQRIINNLRNVQNKRLLRGCERRFFVCIIKNYAKQKAPARVTFMINKHAQNCGGERCLMFLETILFFVNYGYEYYVLDLVIINQQGTWNFSALLFICLQGWEMLCVDGRKCSRGPIGNAGGWREKQRKCWAQQACPESLWENDIQYFFLVSRIARNKPPFAVSTVVPTIPEKLAHSAPERGNFSEKSLHKRCDMLFRVLLNALCREHFPRGNAHYKNLFQTNAAECRSEWRLLWQRERHKHISARLFVWLLLQFLFLSPRLLTNSTARKMSFKQYSSDELKPSRDKNRVKFTLDKLGPLFDERAVIQRERGKFDKG